ncbi:MAG: hypothetical protein CL908_12885 [Deltaproteobacteria bacterium]|nr:hypothetical protein [Deltaproteobacteria bacterium]
MDASSGVSERGSDRADWGPDRGPTGFVAARCARWIAVAGGFGYFPVAPGTAGSFAGVLLFLGLWIGTEHLGVAALGLTGGGLTGGGLTGFGTTLALVGAVLFGAGVWASGRAEVEFGRRDDGRIVIDEVVGQLVALMPLAMFFARPAFFPGLVTGFVLFRLFDIWKPGAVRWTERRFEGGFGVMADDVVAGLHAAVCLFAVQVLVFDRFLPALVEGHTRAAGAILVVLLLAGDVFLAGDVAAGVATGATKGATGTFGPGVLA